MTPTEILTKRWDLIQKARLQEMNLLIHEVPGNMQLAAVQALNIDPFWEGLFDELETQLRGLDPDHSYLPENNPE